MMLPPVIPVTIGSTPDYARCTVVFLDRKNPGMVLGTAPVECEIVRLSDPEYLKHQLDLQQKYHGPSPAAATAVLLNGAFLDVPACNALAARVQPLWRLE